MNIFWSQPNSTNCSGAKPFWRVDIGKCSQQSPLIVSQVTFEFYIMIKVFLLIYSCFSLPDSRSVFESLQPRFQLFLRIFLFIQIIVVVNKTHVTWYTWHKFIYLLYLFIYRLPDSRSVLESFQLFLHTLVFIQIIVIVNKTYVTWYTWHKCWSFYLFIVRNILNDCLLFVSFQFFNIRDHYLKRRIVEGIHKTSWTLWWTW